MIRQSTSETPFLRGNVHKFITNTAAVQLGAFGVTGGKYHDSMKKLIAVGFVAVLALTGCSSDNTTVKSDPVAQDTSKKESKPVVQETPKEEAKPVDLTGDWKQTNSASPDNYQAATIDGDVITINWVDETTDSKSIYWVGTFVAPDEPGDTYSWTSDRDVAATDSALLASTDDSKEFTYEAGVLSYEASALGTTTTLKLEKQ